MCVSTSLFFHSKEQAHLAESAWKICAGYSPVHSKCVLSGLLPYAQINACFCSSLQNSSFILILSSAKMKAFSWTVYRMYGKITSEMCAWLHCTSLILL